MANDKIEEKPDATRELIKALLAEILPTAIATGVALARPKDAPDTKGFSRERCPTCKQYKVACNDKHEMVKVLPENEMHFEFFQGVAINGIIYKSTDKGEKLAVPADANIANMVHLWERQENIARFGVKKKTIAAQASTLIAG